MKIEQYRFPAGYIRAKSQPAIVLTISFHKDNAIEILGKLRALSQLIPKKNDFSALPKAKLNTKIIREFSQILYNYYSNYDYPVENYPTIYPLRSNNQNTLVFNCICYSHTPRGFLTLGNWICDLLKSRITDLSKEFNKTSTQIIKNVANVNLAHRMNREFLKFAVKFKIPLTRVDKSLFQFGWGKYGYQLNGTFLEQIPFNYTALARNKILSRLMLQNAGFPVPDEIRVNSKESCKKFVEKFGFPVVLKPFDKDGGVGVTANISNHEELSKAYTLAQKQSKNIIIQNHVKGKEFRLNVFNGKLHWCYERQSASVIGDGISTISTLIKKENWSSRRSKTWATDIKEITINSEVLSVLDQQNLNLESIPKYKKIVYLSNKSNISTGGVPLVVPIGVIHPDNILLIERAAKLFRLDVNGIDFITPDIQKSWMEVGGKIIEINAMPDLSHTSLHIYEMILRDFIDGDGRGASAIILAENFDKKMLTGFIHFCETNGRNLGMIVGDDIVINNTIIAKASGNPLQDCQVLYFDKSIDYIIIVTDCSDKFFRNGLGLDEFDCLCFEQEFDSSYDHRFKILAETISGEICANGSLKKPIKIGGQEITKKYKSLNEYLIMNMPYYDETHRQKFKLITLESF